MAISSPPSRLLGSKVEHRLIAQRIAMKKNVKTAADRMARKREKKIAMKNEAVNAKKIATKIRQVRSEETATCFRSTSGGSADSSDCITGGAENAGEQHTVPFEKHGTHSDLRASG